MKKILTEAKRKAIIADKEKAIVESFARVFNKIKRIDENEINEMERFDATTYQEKNNFKPTKHENFMDFFSSGSSSRPIGRIQ